MNRVVARLIVWACLVALVCCTSLRTVVEPGKLAAGTKTSLSKVLRPTDFVVVEKRDGSKQTMVLTAVTDEALVGTPQHSTESLTVNLGDIARIERRESDTAKTVVLVVAIVAGVYAVAYAVAQASLVSAL